MKYKNCIVFVTSQKMLNPDGSVGNYLVEIEGRFNKAAAKRPFITSFEGAKRWINEQVNLEKFGGPFDTVHR